MLRFKLDENLPTEAASVLRDAGFDALTVLDQEMRASPDGEIARVCRAEHRILVTLDLDFSDIRTYPPSEHAGMIVLRLHDQAKHHVLQVVQSLIGSLNKESIAGHLWMVDETSIRVRGGQA
jgi:predicted nuclease of predicted toxin-antitoxin system